MKDNMLQFNAVEVTIWGIPGYFFLMGIALVLSTCVFIILLSEKKYSIEINVRILAISVLVLIVFARLFGCLSGIYRDFGMGNKITISSIKNTGIVFYGGLFGVLLSYAILIRLTRQEIYVIDILAVCVPLFHSISRVGCFVGGCCFGVECDSIVSILYTCKAHNDIITANRLPTQLIEATFNLCLFFYLFVLLKRDDWKTKSILNRYLGIYSIGRFLIEFIRGDTIRGMIFGISFSQIISIIIWIYLILLKIKSSVNKKEELDL